MKIGFARRGFSASGGAENYLKRLARGLVEAGQTVELFPTPEWPAAEWPFGGLTTVHAETPIAFADELDRVWPGTGCDLLMSLERVWQCDVYRAGDGVHRAWLERRAKMSGPLRRFLAPFNRKHAGILRLEETLLAKRRAARVIVNSQMVRNEIVEFYGYPSAQIDLVYTGVPLEIFLHRQERRPAQRQKLGLSEDEIALLFAGSGWERKGLREAIDAVAGCKNSKVRLLVAGRGNQTGFTSTGAQFLGVVDDMPALYSAADIFILPTFYDPFSNACLEALASGLPVITTRDNGFSEIIDHGVQGSIVDHARDIDALRDAIDFWCDSTTRENVRPAILDRARRFDISKNVEQTLGLLLQLAASAASVSGKMRKT